MCIFVTKNMQRYLKKKHNVTIKIACVSGRPVLQYIGCPILKKKKKRLLRSKGEFLKVEG